MLSFESEIKVNQQWHQAELVNITEREFILKLKTSVIEYKTPRLVLKKASASFKPSPYVSYSIDQHIEFYSTNSWVEGQIKAKRGEFYVISYDDQDNCCHKILGSDSIRELTPRANFITLEVEKCIRISLKNWSSLPFPLKKISKLIDKLNVVLKELISFIYSTNFTLFIFGDNIEPELIKELIKVAYEHFIELEKEEVKDKSTQLSTTKSSAAGKSQQEMLVIEKIIFDMQKARIDQLKKANSSLKIDSKATKNMNEVCVTITSKDLALFTEAKKVLDLMQKYVTIPIKESDDFFSSKKETERNLLYFASLYEIRDCNFFKHDEKSTTIRLIGQCDMIEYFTRSVKSFCEKNERIKEKENTLAQIKSQILNLS